MALITGDSLEKLLKQVNTVYRRMATKIIMSKIPPVTVSGGH
jgi:hypothetical protein